MPVSHKSSPPILTTGIAFMSDNDLTGTMPAEVCALRNNTSPPGVLGVLVTDCGGDAPKVDCPLSYTAFARSNQISHHQSHGQEC